MNAVNPNLPVPLEHGADTRASGLQIAVTAIAAIFILGIFFYGISRQPSENGESGNRQMAAAPAQPSAQPTSQHGESGKSTQVQQSSQQQNKAQQSINQKAAQAPSGSATTGQGSGDQNNGANGKTAPQTNTPPAKQPQQNGGQQPQAKGTQ